MKKNRRGEKSRWDPIVVKLVDNKIKRETSTGKDTELLTLTRKENSLVELQERRSKEDFEAFLKSLFDNDPLKVKYQNPDAWNVRARTGS